MDQLDMQILSELVKDSSLSVPKLSKKISVNPSVVYSRIKRLVKRDFIKRFTIEVNDGLLGYAVVAVIGVNIDSKFRERILEDFLKLEEVREISEVTGRFDLIVNVKARSLDELHELISGEIGRLEGVLHTETFVEMKRQQKETTYAVA